MTKPTTDQKATAASLYADDEAILAATGIEPASLAVFTPETRQTMLQQARAGELTELTIDIVAFRAIYPNSNFMRFRDEELGALATSFAGQPFLRNHDVWDIGARDGTITAGRLQGQEFIQTVKLTTQRGIIDFLQGVIDRFSIGWYYQDIHCSICQSSWYDCNHWPGHRYQTGPKDNTEEQLCELIFIKPRGKETSAVNAPAVQGTKVLEGQQVGAMLAELIANKEQHLESTRRKGEASETETTTTAQPPTFAPIELTPIFAAPPSTPPEEPAMITQADTQQATPPSVEQAPAEVTVLATKPNPEIDATLAKQQADLQAQMQAMQAMQAQLKAMQDLQEQATRQAQQAAISTMLQASQLPIEAIDAVRVAIRPNDTTEQVATLIEAQRKALAASRPVVHDIAPAASGRFSNMLTNAEKFKIALFALLDNEARPAHGLQPLAGLREAYIMASGDWDMTGRYKGEQAQLANITSASLPDLMAEWLNQRVVSIWQNYDQWYKMFCEQQNFSSLRDPHWIKIGGVGELSEVGEGTAYTEKEWSAESETSKWTKRGNWVGITVEAIDRDMTGYVQQLPRALAQGAYLTICNDFTRRLITANGAGYGNTLSSDTLPLFHATHTNLGNSALSYAAWEATRLAMARQGEKGTGTALGDMTIPRYIMVPRHLETTALAMLATERVMGSGNNDVAPLAMPGDSITARLNAAKSSIVVNDGLGLRNDWFAFADPAKYPLFGLGFRYGEAPEIFSVADPTAGLMFTNDVMPIKIRWYYSLGPIDYRGMYYHRVG